MKQKVFRVLADLRFSIFILLLISLFSIVGTVIEQDQPIEVYKTNYPLSNPVFKIFSWNQILRFGLDHVYTTWWFLSLIFLFGLSLTLCSFLQQLPSLKIARRCQFFRVTTQFSFLKITTVLKNSSFSKVLYEMKKKNYSIFQQKNIVYCYKGLIGRISPIIVHFSLILILFGITLGSLVGFKSQEIIPKTESFHIQNLLNSGYFANLPKTTARINDFWITYTKTKTIAQFYSDLSILDDKGDEITRKTVSVNYPLVFKNVYYYQTDWNLIGLRFEENENRTVQYPLLDIVNSQKKVWLTWVSDPLFLQNGILILIDTLQGYCSVYNDFGKFLGNIEINEKTNLYSSLKLLTILSSTGLQIKSDLGILLIYLGFFFLMVSVLMSYTTYSQIWIIRENKNLFIGGNTNRALFEFELEFFKLAK